MRSTPDPGLRDLSSAVLWNLSSCDSLKQIVIQDALQILAKLTVRSEPKVFTNVTGCLRNLSSAGAQVRKRLRSFKGMFYSQDQNLIHLINKFHLFLRFYSDSTRACSSSYQRYRSSQRKINRKRGLYFT